MKKLNFIKIVLLTFISYGGFSQAFEIQLALNTGDNTLTVQMRNISAVANNPAAGENISTISFEVTGAANITGVASTDYTLTVPNSTTNIVSMSSASLSSPEDWPINEWIDVAVYNVTAGSGIEDFVVTSDEDGDNSDPNDPVMSVLTANGFNQSIAVSQTVLPIKVRSFNVSKRDEKSASLDWSTSSEINGSHFDVQRSQNLDDWTTIGKVQAIGESTTLQNYNLIDSDLPLSTRSSKTFYYRLNMVDNDGSQEYSEVRTVRFNQDGGDFIVYPNPTANDVFVNLSSITTETGPATLNVFNMTGQNVKQVALSSNDDIRVDISNISTGAYYFIVRQGEETYSQKVIKID